MLEDASVPSLLERELDWPSPAEVFEPTGGSARMLARLAEEKIGVALRRLCGADGARVGVLTADAATGDTEAPYAIVCHFRRRASAEARAEAHRLAWNFCRAPVLITADPYAVDVWSCCVPPGQLMGKPDPTPAHIETASSSWGEDGGLAARAVESLGWLALVSGKLIGDNPDRFRPEGRADRTLLANMKAARAALLEGRDRLDEDLAHDLLARLMFIQFLFDRRNARGEAALDGAQLSDLHRSGVLSAPHEDLQGVLRHHGDAYALFEWLNHHFNGDLFPAKSADPAIRAAQWAREKLVVGSRHLAVLADLVSGRLVVSSGQLALWRMYAFDTIPLEFVSSIYEEFVSRASTEPRTRSNSPRPPGVHYTPAHLVDFVLDGVLPWDDPNWDLRILDPACGSGAFLVRCFQRLVHRWRIAHPNVRTVPPEVLTHLLERNLRGNDLNAHAVRVASFGLYLAMCDHLDLRGDWTGIRFPELRERSLLTRDHFAGDATADAVAGPGERFDLVVGNAPWGTGTMTPPARAWAEASGWPVPNDDVGTLFLGRCIRVLRDGGRLAMIQSAGSVLTNDGSAAVRRELFRRCRVEEIVNLSILRFRLFPEATGPACIVTLTAGEPDGSATLYACPKLLGTPEDHYRIVIDDPDAHDVHPWEIEDPWTWSVLTGASRRDLDLLRRMRDGRDTLRAARRRGDLEIQEGLIPGEKRPVHPSLRDRHVLFDDGFPDGTFLTFPASALPRRKEIRAHRPTKASVFDPPQLLIKQALRKGDLRYRAAMPTGHEGVVCSQSYLTAHAKGEAGTKVLLAALATVNSRAAAYYLSLTAGRISYRPELKAGDLYDLPLAAPDLPVEELDDHDALDAAVETAFGLTEADRILLEDGLGHVVPDLLREVDGPGRRPTARGTDGDRPTAIEGYCRILLRVLAAGSPGRGRHSATIFEETGRQRLPVRIVAVRFGASRPGEVGIETIAADDLSRILFRGSTARPNLGRSARVFDVATEPGGSTPVPVVYLVRPDQERFWTRSAALRDADRIVADGISAIGRSRDGAGAARPSHDA